MPCLDNAMPRPVGVKPTFSAVSFDVGSLPDSSSCRMNDRAAWASVLMACSSCAHEI